jgi:hypothetical protein
MRGDATMIFYAVTSRHGVTLENAALAISINFLAQAV